MSRVLAGLILAAALVTSGCSPAALRPDVVTPEPRTVFIDVEQYLRLHPAYGLTPPLQRPASERIPAAGETAPATPAPISPRPFEDLPGGIGSPTGTPVDLASAQQVLRAEYRMRRRLAGEDPVEAPGARPTEPSLPLVRRRPAAPAEPAPPGQTEDVSHEIAAAHAFELESRRIQEQISELNRRLTGGGLVTAAEAAALRTRLIQRQIELRSLAGPVVSRVPVGPAEDDDPAEVRRIPIERLRQALSPPRQRQQVVTRSDPAVQRELGREARRAEAQARGELRLSALREEEEQRLSDLTDPPPLEPIQFVLSPPGVSEPLPAARLEMAAAVSAAGRAAPSKPVAAIQAAAVHPDRASLLAELRSIASNEARKLGWRAVFEPGAHPDATSELRPRVAQAFGFWQGSGPPAGSAR